MIEPLIRWLRASHKGYGIASCGLQHASKWYADDGTLFTHSVENMIVLLDLVQQFSKSSNIHLNVNKCKITAFIHDHQAILRKRNTYDALRARLAHVNMAGCPIGSLRKDGLSRHIPHCLPMLGCPSSMDKRASEENRQGSSKSPFAPSHQTTPSPL